MSDTPRPFCIDKSQAGRKRGITTCEDRVPTPYPTLGPKHPRISNRFLEPAKPEPSKKVTVVQAEAKDIPSKDDDSTSNSLTETPTSAQSPIYLPSHDPNVEKLNDQINEIVDELLERIVANVETVRRNILQEIFVTFGDANFMEKFEDEIQSKTVEDVEVVVGGLDGHGGGKNTKSKSKPDEGDAIGDKKEFSDGKNPNPLPVDYDLSFEA